MASPIAGAAAAAAAKALRAQPVVGWAIGDVLMARLAFSDRPRTPVSISASVTSLTTAATVVVLLLGLLRLIIIRVQVTVTGSRAGS